MNNVIKLVKKELIFIKGAMKMQLVMSLVFLVIFPILSPQLCLFGCVMVPYLLIYGAMAFEEKSKGEEMTAVLPVSRKEICLSRYALGMLYTVIGLIITGISMKIGGLLRPNTPEVIMIIDNLFMNLVLVGALILSYTALILPVLLKFGTEKSKYIMFALYLVAFMFLGKSTEIMGTGVFNPSALIVFAVGSYLLSIMISLGIYQKREFR